MLLCQSSPPEGIVCTNVSQTLFVCVFYIIDLKDVGVKCASVVKHSHIVNLYTYRRHILLNSLCL